MITFAESRVHQKMIQIQMHIYGEDSYVQHYLTYSFLTFMHMSLKDHACFVTLFVDLSASDLLVSFACQVVIDPSSCGMFKCREYCLFTLIAGQVKDDTKRSCCMTIKFVYDAIKSMGLIH